MKKTIINIIKTIVLFIVLLLVWVTSCDGFIQGDWDIFINGFYVILWISAGYLYLSFIKQETKTKAFTKATIKMLIVFAVIYATIQILLLTGRL